MTPAWVQRVLTCVRRETGRADSHIERERASPQDTSAMRHTSGLFRLFICASPSRTSTEGGATHQNGAVVGGPDVAEVDPRDLASIRADRDGAHDAHLPL